MAIVITSNSGKTHYALRQYVCDTNADIVDLPIDNIWVGSTAFVIESGETYMLNSALNWVKVDLSGGGGSSSEDLQTVAENFAPAYDETQTYSVGDLVVYQYVLYKCITAVSTPEEFDYTKWEYTTLESSFEIDDSDVSAVKTWSSSKLSELTLPDATSDDENKLISVDSSGNYELRSTIDIGRKANTTVGTNSTAEGSNTTASGNNSHAEGSNTTASGEGSHAEGSQSGAGGGTISYTVASGIGAHAEGGGTMASGDYSHSEGERTFATGSYSHTEGSNTRADSYGSHAEGGGSRAMGHTAHAEGWSTFAIGTGSHSEGSYTSADYRSQHVFGEYNVIDPSVETNHGLRGTYVEIVGNGDYPNTRSNARTLDWSGNETLAGKLTVGTQPTAANDVTTKQYVDGLWNTFITGTILTGEDTLTIQNASITSSTMFDIYSSVYSIVPDEVTVVTGSITLTFNTAVESDVTYKIRLIEG